MFDEHWLDESEGDTNESDEFADDDNSDSF